MRPISILFIIAVSVPLAASQACSPYSPDLGSAPFLCGTTDPKCPDGYTCMTAGSADVCVGGGSDSVPDGGHGNCADDSSLEPNDTIQTAWISPVADTKATLVLAGLAICPAGDKDTYNIHIPTEGMNIEVIVVYDSTGMALSVQILNSTGVAIAMGSPVSGQTDTVRAYTAMVPSGTYYAQVTASASGGTNNYKMTINATGP